MGLDEDNELSSDTHLSPQHTGSSGIVPRRGILYSDASFCAPPLEKSAQYSCGCTQQICHFDVIMMSFYYRWSWRLGLRWDPFLSLGRQSIHSQTISKCGKRVCMVFWATLTCGELLLNQRCNCIWHLGLKFSDSLRLLQGVGHKPWEGCEVSRDNWSSLICTINNK